MTSANTEKTEARELGSRTPKSTLDDAEENFNIDDNEPDGGSEEVIHCYIQSCRITYRLTILRPTQVIEVIRYVHYSIL